MFPRYRQLQNRICNVNHYLLETRLKKGSTIQGRKLHQVEERVKDLARGSRGGNIGTDKRKHNPDNSDNKLNDDESIAANPDEILLIKDKGEVGIKEVYGSMDPPKEEFQFEKVIDHFFKNGLLIFKANYQSETLGEDNVLDVPFEILKKGAQIAVARYIKEYVVELLRRKGYYNEWATKKLTEITRQRLSGELAEVEN
eukprot:4312482-Ditylum_brightwellii.AAC.1